MSCRLYLITPPVIDNIERFVEGFADALTAGDVACVQLRLKSKDGVTAEDEQILRVADKLLPVAHQREVALLINDRPDLAKTSGADGVHIGQQDAGYDQARALLGADASIGVTCHNSRHLALEAAEAGADYVAFGAFYQSRTKEPPDYAEPGVLTWWQEATTVPCVAIGGIGPGNCAPLVRAGADFLAVSAAVWDHPDGPAEGVRAMNEAIVQA